LALIVDALWSYAAVAVVVAVLGHGEGPAPSFIGVAAVVVGSFALARALQETELTDAQFRGAGACASAIAIFAIVHIEYGAATPPWDVAWMRASMGLDREGNEQDAMAMAQMFDAIDSSPVPVIARVQGAALGGGMGLCAVSDLVIAEAGARFGFTETRLGLLPAVIAPFVIAKVGESHARALFPGGRRFDATRALRIGLVHEVVEGIASLDAAVDVAIADLLAAGPTAARAAKAIVREVRGLPHDSTRWHTARRILRWKVSVTSLSGFSRIQ
jgi:hypothetical protein